MSSSFLWYPGTSSNNGLVVSLLTLMTTEIESLANTSTAVSSVAGASGVFNNSGTGTGQGIFCDLFFSFGNPGVSTALSAGANISGWYLTSPDNGTTFEPTTVAPPRAPDFIIPLPATTIGTSGTPYRSTGGPGSVTVPALPFKVLIQNNTGQTFGNGTPTVPYLKMAIYTEQY